ncbi:cyclodeaminase/cyclohydrolase family protein [bacterium]|nr:cyclodeaminase/cyclohydrolase family protein [bacterium]
MNNNTGISELTVGEVLSALSSDRPDWGGGSAVLLGAAMGTCLLAMAARISAAGVRQGKLAGCAFSAEELDNVGSELAAQADELADWAARDGALYGKVVEAQRLPKEEPEVRSAAVEKALRGAIEGPLQAAEMMLQILHRAEELAGCCKKANISDVQSGVQLVLQGVRGVLLNVKQNCGSRECFAAQKQSALVCAEQTEALAAKILAACADRVK